MSTHGLEPEPEPAPEPEVVVRGALDPAPVLLSLANGGLVEDWEPSEAEAWRTEKT